MAGDIRRLTVFFADLVGSTALSTQVEPETYRLVVGKYREQALEIVSQHGGQIGSIKGDGLLAGFGWSTTHDDDDASRAVRAGLDIAQAVGRLSDQSKRRFDFDVNVRVGVHRGLVYLDTNARDAFYGAAAAVATGLSGTAAPGAVVVSDAVATLIRNDFELEVSPPALVAGIDEPIARYRVVGEGKSASSTPPEDSA